MIDNQSCFICGDSNENRLHKHHIVPREYGGSDTKSNLTYLCASCHQAVHKLLDERFFDRLESYFNHHSTPVNLDIDGSTVSPKESYDRKIPESEHITVVQNTVEIDIESVRDGQYEDYLTDWEFEEANFIIDQINSNLESINSYFEMCSKRREKYDIEQTGKSSFEISPGDPIQNPYIIISLNTKHSAVSRGEGAHRDYHKLIHCGYCHTVFEGSKQSNVAKHLQIRHRVEDLYEQLEHQPQGNLIHDKEIGR